jgi:hypothetical protein
MKQVRRPARSPHHRLKAEVNVLALVSAKPKSRGARKRYIACFEERLNLL